MLLDQKNRTLKTGQKLEQTQRNCHTFVFFFICICIFIFCSVSLPAAPAVYCQHVAIFSYTIKKMRWEFRSLTPKNSELLVRKARNNSNNRNNRNRRGSDEGCG